MNNDLKYKELISDLYFITKDSVANIKNRFGFKTYKRTYKQILLMEKTISFLGDAFADKLRPRDIKELYPNSKNPNAASSSFVGYLYRTKDKGIVSKGVYKKSKEAIKLLKKKGLI